MQQKTAIFVIGHSPAIVTETLAACSLRDHLVINRLILITTHSGAEILQRRFFDEDAWQQFIDCYPQFASTPFSHHSIICCADHDISNVTDNRAMAEAIFDQVRQVTADDQPPVIASLAGGYKTMSYYMGFAMSLFGREFDRLTHVHAPREWDNATFPIVPPPDECHKINLIDIPFIRLRAHLKPAIIGADIETLIRSAQTTIDLSALPPLTLRIIPRTIDYLDQTIALSEREFTFVQFFAQQKTRHCQRSEQRSCEDCQDCFLSVDDMDVKKDELLHGLCHESVWS